MEPPCNIEEYIDNYDNVNWMDVARFAAIDDVPTRVVKRGDILYRYGDWSVR